MLIAALLLGLICMGIADYSACSIGDAVSRAHRQAPWAVDPAEIRVMLTSAVSTWWLDFFQKPAQALFLEIFAIPVCQASPVPISQGEAVMWICGHQAMTSGSPFLAELFLSHALGMTSSSQIASRSVLDLPLLPISRGQILHSAAFSTGMGQLS